MNFRYARHTRDLKKIERFYTEVVGLENLGGFINHNGYDGLLLGHRNTSWHLEFTVSEDLPTRQFDDDDLLVFYVNSEVELQRLKRVIAQNNIDLVIPKNPYWADNGILIADPDGFKIVFAIRHLVLESIDDLTKQVKDNGLLNWNDLIEFVKALPYGRNANREDLSLVLLEKKGTCSSKHAFLKKVADLNGFENVKLILAMYRMNHINTPKIGDTIAKHGLDFIPEAHCYLMLNNQRIDITNSQSDIERLRNEILEEIEINADQVNVFKVDYHKLYLEQWIAQNGIDFSFEKVWEIREACIRQLEA